MYRLISTSIQACSVVKKTIMIWRIAGWSLTSAGHADPVFNDLSVMMSTRSFVKKLRCRVAMKTYPQIGGYVITFYWNMVSTNRASYIHCKGFWYIHYYSFEEKQTFKLFFIYLEYVYFITFFNNCRSPLYVLIKF